MAFKKSAGLQDPSGGVLAIIPKGLVDDKQHQDDGAILLWSPPPAPKRPIMSLGRSACSLLHALMASCTSTPSSLSWFADGKISKALSA